MGQNAKPTTKALACNKCGDCRHWELIRREKDQFVKCMTCLTEYPAAVATWHHTSI